MERGEMRLEDSWRAKVQKMELPGVKLIGRRPATFGCWETRLKTREESPGDDEAIGACYWQETTKM